MNFAQILTLALAMLGVSNLSTTAAKPLPPSVGMELVSAPVSGDVAVSVTLWYPSTSVTRTQTLGPYQVDVAMAGQPVAKRFPLVIMSHGTGGSAFGAINLAIALAKAGFVVAAVEHTGDNYRDQSRSFTPANFASRPHQISAAIDFILTDWRNKRMINPTRIGMFGHSAGGTTTLIVSGGVLNWSNVVRFCVNQPEDWGCKQSSQRTQTREQVVTTFPPINEDDSRVKALVIAAPALSHGFAPSGLAGLKLPVQLWVAGKDVIVPDAGQISGLLTAKIERHDVANAGHFSFLPSCSDNLRKMAAEICSDPQGFDRTVFQQEFTGAVIRFFQRQLRR
jgi:predicted dienelactone hydrolase